MEANIQVEKLRLIVRYPSGKPPYVGIIFENKYNASAINQGWVNSYKTYKYQLRLQVMADKSLLVSLSQRNMSWVYSYIVEKYEESEIKQLITRKNVFPTINFGHCLIIDNLLTPARTSVNQSVWVLKVDTIEYLQDVSIRK